MDNHASVTSFCIDGRQHAWAPLVQVTAPPLTAGQHRIQAVATSAGRTYSTGYQVIEHRDLPLRYLVREATTRVAAMKVAVRPRVRVGYVMGVGDEVPSAINQLGASVTLLDRDALASGDLSRFDVIVTGRAPMPCATTCGRTIAACSTGCAAAAAWWSCTTRRSSSRGVRAV
jgi:hypothetical protein